MEPSHDVSDSHQDIVAKIDQKAVRLSALLREIDNDPVELPASQRAQLDGILEQLACRVMATRALLRQSAAERDAAIQLSGAIA